MFCRVCICIFVFSFSLIEAQNNILVKVAAGYGGIGWGGDLGPATDALLNMDDYARVCGIWIDSSGTMYVPEYNNGRIRVVNPQGIISTMAGTGAVSTAGGSGPPLLISFSHPTAIVGNAAGTVLYITDSKYIWKYDFSTNIISVFAGKVTGGVTTNGVPATSADLRTPRGLWLTTSGNLYLSCEAKIRKIVGSPGIISSVVGTGSFGGSGDGGAATLAKLNNPSGIYVDSTGKLFIADSGNSNVRWVATNGIIFAFAGLAGGYEYYGDNLPATLSSLHGPKDVKGDTLGNIYIADTLNSRIRMVNTAGILITLMGNGQNGYSLFLVPLSPASSMNYPTGLWIDSQNTFYFTEGPALIRKTVSSVSVSPTVAPTTNPFDSLLLQPVAGFGNSGISGDGGPASLAQMETQMFWVDSAGNIYTAESDYDYGTGRIRKISSSSGIITTFAGSGISSTSGITAPANIVDFYLVYCVVGDPGNNFLFISDQVFIWKYSFSDNIVSVFGKEDSVITPMGLWLTTSGVLFVADSGKEKILSFTDAAPTLIAGDGTSSFSGDGGPAVSSRLFNPYAVYVDTVGKVYIADSYNQRIRLVDTNSIITTFAGNGGTAYNGDNIPATLASLFSPRDVKGDLVGNIYIADSGHNRIRLVSPTGIMATFIGTGFAGGSPVVKPLLNSDIDYPCALWIDSLNSVYFSEANYGNTIRKTVTSLTSPPSPLPVFIPNGLYMQLVGGGIASGYSGDNGPATSALINPQGIWMDSAGNLYSCEQTNHRIRKIDHYGIVSTVAGIGSGTQTGATAPASVVIFNTPVSLIGDSLNQFLYISDRFYIWKYSFASNIVAVIAGTGSPGNSGDGGPAISAQVYYPQGLWLTTDNVLYLPSNHRIRKIVSGIISTVTGLGTGGFDGDGSDAASSSVSLDNPYAVFVDSTGKIFIADTGNHRIRCIDSNNIIRTYAGTGERRFNGDNIPATLADLYFPWDVKGDVQGNIYAPVYTCAIRMINVAGIITTFLGTNICGFSMAQMLPGLSNIFRPVALWIDTSSNVYFSNTRSIWRSILLTPSSQPTNQPTGLPTGQPSRYPSSQPASLPTTLPSAQPSTLPSSQPTHQPSLQGISPNLFMELVAGTASYGFSGDNGPASSAQVIVYWIWGDSVGNIYVPSVVFYRIRKIDTTGIITTFGGTGTMSSAGVGGPVTSVNFYQPLGIAGDTLGSYLYISDTRMIWKCSLATNVAEVIAGGAVSGFSGDGGPATSAQVRSVSGLWLTTSGDLYIADRQNHRVRKIVISSNIISTVAGSGTASFGGDNGLATSASLNNPFSVYVDSNGRLFIADYSNNRIRLVYTNSIITTIAGTGIGTFNGDDLPAWSANINRPSDVKGDSSGNIYVSDSDNCIVRRIDTSGIISTLFGTPGSCGFSSGITSHTSVIQKAIGLWLDTSRSSLYFGDLNSLHRGILVSSPSSQPSTLPSTQPTSVPSCVPSTRPTSVPSAQPSSIPSPIPLKNISPNLFMELVAGTTSYGFNGDNGPATAAQLLSAYIWVDSNGNIYVPQFIYYRIRKIDPTGIITTYGGTGTPSSAGIGGPVASVNFNQPLGIVGDTLGSFLYISDNKFIWKCSLVTNVAEVIGGTSTSGFSGDGGPATSAQLKSAVGLWLTSSGKLYIADRLNARVRMIVISSNIISTVAGSGTVGFGGDNGLATNAALNSPYGVYVNSMGKLFIADLVNCRIRLVDTNNIITTFAGTGTGTFNGDDRPAWSANINNPTDVKGDSSGNIYISDSSNCIVRMIDVSGIISTLFGTPGSCGFSSGITSRTSVIQHPQGLFLDASRSSLYFGDMNSLHRGILVSSPSSQPSTVPSTQPTSVPSSQPFEAPTTQPTCVPSTQPFSKPTRIPSSYPSNQPSSPPTVQPSSLPTKLPSCRPSGEPSSQPSSLPSPFPSSQPSGQPMGSPTSQPSSQPSSFPTSQPSGSPSVQPTGFPTNQPSANPSCQPSGVPSSQPVALPSTEPTTQPSSSPTGQPTHHPTSQPTNQPTSQSTGQPSGMPSNRPSSQPSKQPASKPSLQPSSQPTRRPSDFPSSQPSSLPTSQPSCFPTTQPSTIPTTQPTVGPSSQPTVLPTRQPSSQPSEIPSSQPSVVPSTQPTSVPSTQPSGCPSSQPTLIPTSQPSSSPSIQPTIQPTSLPSGQPTRTPTRQPGSLPSSQPSSCPSSQSSSFPTIQPSTIPTKQPTVGPSSKPTVLPSRQPSSQPSCYPTSQPSGIPSSQPTNVPTSLPSTQPSSCPSSQPTLLPSVQPTKVPTSQPTGGPSPQPSYFPSSQPSFCPTSQPSKQPTTSPSCQPTTWPSRQPSNGPSSQPTGAPTNQPNSVPSCQPTSIPTSQPIGIPSTQPTTIPTGQPSAIPSSQPSDVPSNQPTSVPSSQPSDCPSVQPSTVPSSKPSSQPTIQPSRQPSSEPTCYPTNQPSEIPSSQPSVVPTTSPTSLPSTQPSAHPLIQPTSSPSEQPSSVPSSQPSSNPTPQPTSLPSTQPSSFPTSQPSFFPTNQPSPLPTNQPTTRPSSQPTVQPSRQPSSEPAGFPTNQPSSFPSSHPSTGPTSQPSGFPSSQPSSLPSTQPSDYPSSQPSVVPSTQPTGEPSSPPTTCPSAQPSSVPSNQPSSIPFSVPSSPPSGFPSTQPTSKPSIRPSVSPTNRPSVAPSDSPTSVPSCLPTTQPSIRPTSSPSSKPFSCPTVMPSTLPTNRPTSQPSDRPSSQPRAIPTSFPSRQPVSFPTSFPSCSPTAMLSSQPTVQPTRLPTSTPTFQPTIWIVHNLKEEIVSFFPIDGGSGDKSGNGNNGIIHGGVQFVFDRNGNQNVAASFDGSSGYIEVPSKQVSQKVENFTVSFWINPNIPHLSTGTYVFDKSPSVPGSDGWSFKYSDSNDFAFSYIAKPSSFSGRRKLSVEEQEIATTTSTVMLQLNSSVWSHVTLVKIRSATAVYLNGKLFAFSNITLPEGNLTLSDFPLIIGTSNDVKLNNSNVIPSYFSGLLDDIFIHNRALSGEEIHQVFQFASPTSMPSSQPSGKPSVAPSRLPTSTPTSKPKSRPSSQPSSFPSVQPVVSPTGQPSNHPTAPPIWTVSLAVSFTSIFQFSYVRDEFQVRFPPTVFLTEPLRLSLVLIPRVANITSPAKIVPTKFIIPATSGAGFSSSSSSASLLNAGIIGGSPGSYRIMLLVNSTGYNIIYATSNLIHILPLDSEPPVPKLTSARFSNDGSFIIVKLDSSTNRGGNSFTSTFTCSTYFKFKNVDSSLCNWYDDRTINIYQTSSSPDSLFLNVGHNITLNAIVSLKAACTNPTNMGSCSSWKSVTEQRIVIGPPLLPIAPVIQVSVPTLISPCQSLTLDLTSSSGNGGRNWKSIEIVVTESPTVSDIQQFNQFLNLNYTFSPPGTIPSQYLTKGTNYTFQITLYNFMGAKGTHFFKVRVQDNDNSLIPYATILGPKALNVYRKFTLQLKTTAYTVNCRGEKSYQSLSLIWKMINNLNTSDYSMREIQSTSQNSRTLSLPAYSLRSSTTYTLELIVTSLISHIVTSDRIEVNVLRGSVVPIISGGESQIIQYNVLSFIDGSKSYDDDQSASNTGLAYEWSCIVAPLSSQLIINNNCSKVMSFPTGTLSSKLSIRPFDVATINNTFFIFLKVADSLSSGRSASVTATLKVVTSQLNFISIITSETSVVSIPTTNPLVLTTQLTVFTACRAIWATNSILALESKVSTPVFQQFTLGIQQPFSLRLLPNTLPERSSITFTLTCGIASSAITVTTNGSPIPGDFTVSPLIGKELADSFTFSASLWSDPDLPLTYQFGFISPTTDANLVTHIRSGSTFGSTVLPAGYDVNQNYINCTSEVFDVFNASRLLFRIVTVTPITPVNKERVLNDYIAEQSSSFVGNVEAQRAFISVASSTLNYINCSVPVNCSSLFRTPCRGTPNTCGTCLSGYHGDSSERNTFCERISHFRNVSGAGLSGVCHSDQDCIHKLQTCVNSKCEFLSKRCAADCSNNGRCEYKYISTGLSLSTCTIDDLSCGASCKCVDGFTGQDCSVNQAILPQIQATRSVLIHTLKNLTITDEVNKESVESWASSLRSIVANPAEVSNNDISVVQAIAFKTVSAATDLGLQPSALIGILTAMDGIATNAAQIADQKNATSIPETASLLAVLSQYSQLVASDFVLGEAPKTVIYNNFRMSTLIGLVPDQNHPNSMTAEVPKTEIEHILQTPKSSLELFSTSNSTSNSFPVTVSLIQTFEKSYTSQPSVFYSDPIQFSYSVVNYSQSVVGNHSADYFANFRFKIRHNEAITRFNVGNTTMQEGFHSACTSGISNSTSYLCKPSEKVLVHHCNGSFTGTMISYCPVIIPICNSINVSSSLLSSNHSVCQTVSFTKSETICVCSFGNTNNSAVTIESDRTEKRLSISSATYSSSLPQRGGTSNLVAATEFLVNDFLHTFSGQNALGSSAGAEKSKIMIIVICTIWGGGFLLFLIISFRENHYFTFKEREKLIKKAVAMTSVSRKALKQLDHDQLIKSIKEEIFRYIDLLIPAVYNTKETFFQRCFSELGLHHRYFLLFMVDSRRVSAIARFYKTVKILSVLTLTTFLQALLFDLQNPDDDGSCRPHHNEFACFTRRTALDQSQSYCQWDGVSHSCSYAAPVFSETAVVYVMIITAICTVVFKIPVDFCLKIWLCPVYEEKDFVKPNQVIPISETEEEDTNTEKKKKNNRHLHYGDIEEDRSFFSIPYLGIMPFFLFPLTFLWKKVAPKSNTTGKREVPKEVTELHTTMSSGLDSFLEKVHFRSFKTQNERRVVEWGDVEEGDVENMSSLSSSTGITSEEKFVKDLCENIIRCRIELKRSLTNHPVTLNKHRGDESSDRHEKNTSRMWQLFNDQWGVLPDLIASENSSEAIIAGQAVAHVDSPNSSDTHILDTLTTSSLSKDSLTIFSLFDPLAIEQFLKFSYRFQKMESKAQLKLEKLDSENASIELMYIFIMDLLGQTTSAAKIFHNKFNEDYEIRMIVTRIFKFLCISFIFAVNGFFIYFLLLKSITKGLSWQIQFVKMIVSSFLIEIFLFETIECLFLNYFIPESVNKDVYNAVYVLEIIAENLDNFIMHQEREIHESLSRISSSSSSNQGVEFDASNFLFLSKSLIRMKPRLGVEAFIIHSYQNHFPGLICYSWKHFQRRNKLAKKRSYEKSPTNQAVSFGNLMLENENRSVKVPSSAQRRGSFLQFIPRRYSRYVVEENNPPLGDDQRPQHQHEHEAQQEEEDDNNESIQPRKEKESHLQFTGKYVFLLITTLSSGILYVIQTLGILPMFSQKIVVRLLQTSILSGLTLLYYTSQQHKPYFAVFGGIISILILLIILRNAYNQYEKNKYFHNNVLKQKVEKLKERMAERREREKEKDEEQLEESQSKLPDGNQTPAFSMNIFDELMLMEKNTFGSFPREEKNTEDEFNDELAKELKLKRSKRSQRRERKEQERVKQSKHMQELEDIKYSSPSFKPVAPQLQQDREFLKSLDYLAALANADYTPLNNLPDVVVSPKHRVQPTLFNNNTNESVVAQSIMTEDDGYQSLYDFLNDDSTVYTHNTQLTAAHGKDEISFLQSAKYYLGKSFQNNNHPPVLETGERMNSEQIMDDASFVTENQKKTWKKKRKEKAKIKTGK
jgi:hypothetical protein